MPIKRKNPQPTGVRGIKKDGPGRFLVRVTFRDPKTGKPRSRERVARTLEEAVRLKEQLRRNALEERSPSRRRFGDYAVQWLEERANELAESTKERYANALAHLTVEFGDYWIDALAPADIRGFQSRSLKNYAPSTINGWIHVLRHLLTMAEQDGLVRWNAARWVRVLRVGRTQGRRGKALGPEQFLRFFSTLRRLVENGRVSEDVERMLIVAGWSGMRLGELLALRFGDAEQGSLHIRRSVWKRVVKATKTDDPRVLAFSGPLASAVDEQRVALVRQQHPGLRSGLVFPADPERAVAAAKRRGVDEISWFRSGRSMNQAIRAVVEEAGLPPITLHSFRRTYENLLRQAGVDDLVRRSLAGWRSSATQTIYAGVDESERAAAVVAMESLLDSVLESASR